MSSVVDLTAVPLIDNHCHGMYCDPTPLDLATWRTMLTESTGQETQGRHVATTLAYRRLMHRLARYFDCEDEEQAVLDARSSQPVAELTSALLLDARFEALVLDTGIPAPQSVFAPTAVERMGSLRVAPLLRVELLMQDLIAQFDALDDVENALRVALADVRAQGYVGLKSIVAYRTGLDIALWPRDDAKAAFASAREVARRDGSVRIADKPLLDTLLHVVFQQASAQELPVQFHTGYGDTDADMLLANPLHLRPVLQSSDYRGMHVVLLHECYPYTREGAYLAAMYDRVYLDLSYAIPSLGYREMERFTRAAFSVAPFSKLLYSSDGIGLPELHWMSAHDGRRIVGTVIGELVQSGDLTLSEAQVAGQAVLHGNAARLYAL